MSKSYGLAKSSKTRTQISKHILLSIGKLFSMTVVKIVVILLISFEYGILQFMLPMDSICIIRGKKFKKFKEIIRQTSRKRLNGPKKDINSMFLST